jgi:hypothetical protein
MFVVWFLFAQIICEEQPIQDENERASARINPEQA